MELSQLFKKTLYPLSDKDVRGNFIDIDTVKIDFQRIYNEFIKQMGSKASSLEKELSERTKHVASITYSEEYFSLTKKDSKINLELSMKVEISENRSSNE